jgi:hypothetical protein
MIGYLGRYVAQDGAYYAGLLVTNVRGVPREFRHSEGIKPSRLQTALYGESLEDSLGSDALAPALYDALGARPDLLLINEEGRDLFGRFATAHCPAAMLVQYPDRDMAFGESLSEGGELLVAAPRREISACEPIVEPILASLWPAVPCAG